MRMHADEIDIEVAAVRGLIRAQFPQWSELPVESVRSAGTVNAIFRVGSDLVARFPLVVRDREEVRASMVAEAQAMREFADVSSFPAPRAVALGEPGQGYPMPWSVQTWIPGHDATVEDPSCSPDFAHDIAALIANLRRVDVRGRRFDGAGRGGHVPDHDEWLEVCFDNSHGLLDVARLRTIWSDLRSLPEVDDDAMCHRDLTPTNVLVEGGRLAGVVDTGSFGPADPALDLVAAWHLLDTAQRTVVRTTLGCSEVQWNRGMAWAFQQSMGLVWYYAESNPTMSRWGRRTLDRIVDAMGA